jgi:hypothetical protein
LPGLAGSPPAQVRRFARQCVASLKLPFSLWTFRRGINGALRRRLPSPPSPQTLRRGPPGVFPGPSSGRSRQCRPGKRQCPAGTVAKNTVHLLGFGTSAAPGHPPRDPLSALRAYICRWRYEYLSGRNRDTSTAIRAQALKEVLLPGLAGSPPAQVRRFARQCVASPKMPFSLLTVRRGINGALRRRLPSPPSSQTLRRGPPRAYSRARAVAGPGSAGRGSGNARLVP